MRGPVVYSVVRKDGTLAEVESRVWAQDVAGGRSYTATVRDVSQRLAAERELLDLNRSLDEFAAVAAQDLRAPIAAIRINLELVEDSAHERGDDDELATVARIQHAADRGIRIIDDLLAYSRTGRDALSRGRVDLTPLARGLAADVTARVGRPCEIDVQEMPPAEGDAGALGQVLANLLFNAVHYGPADGVARVTVSAESTGRRELLVRVTDNGQGIPPAERERVFEMFQRGTNSGGRSGTGVGLALCRRVVERHGGRIWIEDARATQGAQGTAGSGTSMCFTLPRHFDPLNPSVTAALRIPPILADSSS